MQKNNYETACGRERCTSYQDPPLAPVAGNDSFSSANYNDLAQVMRVKYSLIFIFIFSLLQYTAPLSEVMAIVSVVPLCVLSSFHNTGVLFLEFFRASSNNRDIFLVKSRGWT